MPDLRYDDARERFERDTADHELTVLRDDGLYRHLRFQKPGTSIYYFDLVTWPGYLAIVGDAGDYVFSRVRDMFEFFEGGADGINPGYWAEKLQGPGRDMARSYSAAAFRSRLREWLADASEELAEAEAAALRAALHEQVLDDERVEWGETHARELLQEFEHDGHRIYDSSWEWDFREFDARFLWCCWAIVWGIREYRAATTARGAA